MTLPDLLRDTIARLYGKSAVAALETPPPETETTELQRIADAAEAERFRLEIERDARGDGSDWPDGS
jgi:hypothetical protein